MSNRAITLNPIAIRPEEFLSAFYAPDDMVYLRSFDDKKRVKIGKKEQCYLRDFNAKLPTLRQWNSEEWGIFFVVNGGGQNDEEVMRSGRCTAQFMECDDLSLADQLEQINAFPLEPSIVVKTRKSLHTYWLLKDGNIKHFREIQLALVEHFHSDPVLKNESRVMRLPSFNHCKGDPVPVQVVHWRPDLKYTQRDLAAVLPRPKRQQKTKTGPISGDPIPEGQRVSTLVSLIGSLKHANLSDDAIRSAIRTENEARCTPPLSDEDLEREVFPAVRRFPSEPSRPKYNQSLIDQVTALQPEKRYKWSDIGNGELFSDVFRNRVRYNVTAKEWYQYTGKIWTMDTGGMIASSCAQELQKALLIYSTTIEDPDVRDKYIDYVKRLGQNGARKKMLDDARAHNFISAEDLDTDPMILNTQNTVLNLRTWTRTAHSPDLMLSRICNVDFDPEAKGARWNQFISEVMQGDQEKADYLQRVCGYALTGETREETSFIIYGKTTRNGKGTMMETIKYMLGGDKGYSLAINPETLAKKDRKDNSRASGDIARLNRCRFLNMSEPGRGMIFDAALLKTMLGRDTITARHLFEREFEFTPQFKLFINTNYLPVIKDPTLFSSGRVNVITFDKHFEEYEQDKDLKDKLRDPKELSGVLNWMLEGLRKYQESGLSAPECVRNATEEYREESDKIGNFFDECMEYCAGCVTRATNVYSIYEVWCNINGYGCENKGNFFAELRTRNLLATSGTINGITERNVIRNYRITDSDTWIRRTENDT